MQEPMQKQVDPQASTMAPEPWRQAERPSQNRRSEINHSVDTGKLLDNLRKCTENDAAQVLQFILTDQIESLNLNLHYMARHIEYDVGLVANAGTVGTLTAAM